MPIDDLVQNAPDSGATPTPSPTPAAPAAPAPQAAPSGSPQAPATGVPEGWVPSYRVRETRESAIREANAEFARKEADYQARIERAQNQVRALVGVNPPNANPEVDAIRQQFSSLYPGLSKLEEQAAAIQEILERSSDLEQQTTHYWQGYGRQAMDRLFSAASATLGAPLSDSGKRQLHQAFIGYVQSSPEMTARYAEDPTIVEDFWKEFSSNLIDPVRRASSAAVAGRAPMALPQDTPGGAPRVAPPAPPKDLDERASMAWATYAHNAK